MGASEVYPLSEDSNINALLNHTVYGLVTSEVAVRLGDESLFKPSQAKNSLLSEPATTDDTKVKITNKNLNHSGVEENNG